MTYLDEYRAMVDLEDDMHDTSDTTVVDAWCARVDQLVAEGHGELEACAIADRELEPLGSE